MIQSGAQMPVHNTVQQHMLDLQNSTHGWPNGSGRRWLLQPAMGTCRIDPSRSRRRTKACCEIYSKVRQILRAATGICLTSTSILAMPCS